MLLVHIPNFPFYWKKRGRLWATFEDIFLGGKFLFNSKIIYSSVRPKKLNNISYISHVFTKTKQKYFELSWNSSTSQSYVWVLFVCSFSFLSNSYKFWIHFHEKNVVNIATMQLSIFPASVHQFYANILVFVNINPFLYINDQFALVDIDPFLYMYQQSICIG